MPRASARNPRDVEPWKLQLLAQGRKLALMAQKRQLALLAQGWRLALMEPQQPWVAPGRAPLANLPSAWV